MHSIRESCDIYLNLYLCKHKRICLGKKIESYVKNLSQTSALPIAVKTVGETAEVPKLPPYFILSMKVCDIFQTLVPQHITPMCFYTNDYYLLSIIYIKAKPPCFLCQETNFSTGSAERVTQQSILKNK